MRWLLVACVLAGCGRGDFNPDGQVTDATGDSSSSFLDGGPAARSTLALDKISPTEVLDDFPLLVVLDDTHAARDLLDATASNLRFVDASGNVLASEVEQVGTVGGAPLCAWVLILQIADNVDEGDRRDRRHAGQAASSTSVWSSNYEAVYHFQQRRVRLHDAHHHDGLAVGNVLADVGTICGANSFDGSSYYDVTDMQDLDFATITITAWVYQRTMSTGVAMPAVAREAVNSDQDFRLGSDNNFFFDEVTVTGEMVSYLNGSTVTVGHWTQLALTADTLNLDLYIDASLRRIDRETRWIVQHDFHSSGARRGGGPRRRCVLRRRSRRDSPRARRPRPSLARVRPRRGCAAVTR